MILSMKLRANEIDDAERFDSFSSVHFLLQD